MSLEEFNVQGPEWLGYVFLGGIVVYILWILWHFIAAVKQSEKDKLNEEKP